MKSLKQQNFLAEEFIEKLPNKYDTLIGENGIRLSGGEKTKVIYSKSNSQKKSIILLDEAIHL